MAFVVVAGPEPAAFIATTEKVYDTPVLKPPTVMGDVALVPANPPGVDVAL